jgi:hypothetical protein
MGVRTTNLLKDDEKLSTRVQWESNPGGLYHILVP